MVTITDVIHYLNKDENILCGLFVRNRQLINATTDELKAVTCPSCKALALNNGIFTDLKKFPLNKN